MSEPEFSPEPVETESAPSPEAVESPWSPAREEWEQVTRFVGAAAPVLGQIAQAMQHGYQQPAYQQQPYEPEPAPNFDPFEPETVRNYIRAEIDRGVEEGLRSGLEPYGPLLETVASTEGERQARAVLENLSSSVGAFDEDAAMILAAGLMGQGSVAPDHALRVSAQYLHELETRVREDERSRYMKEIENLSNAPSEHPVAGTPGATEMESVPTGPDRYKIALDRAMARRNAGLPVG